MVPVTGVEPVRCLHHWILSPARLPIPSHRQNTTKAFYHISSILSTVLFKNIRLKALKICCRFNLNLNICVPCNVTANVYSYRQSCDMSRRLLNIYRQCRHCSTEALRTYAKLVYFFKHSVL